MYNVFVILFGKLDEMLIKNTSDHKDSHHDKLSSSKMGKFVVGTFLAINLLSGKPVYSQNHKTSDNLKKKTTSELVINMNDSSDHKKIITTDIKKILATYGPEKGLKIIRNHMMIEINTYRKLNKREPLTLDPVLNDAAQKFAEYGSKYKALGHSFDGKGVEDIGVDLDNFLNMGENVSYNEGDIATIVSNRYKHESHKKNMIGLNISKYTGKTIPYTLLGIGLSGNFVVAEFATPIK